MLKKMNNMNIKGRLNYVFRLIIIAFSVVAVVISAMMIYMSMDYRRVLKRYAFPQGDIATAMSEAAEIRGASRGVVGYDSVSLISSMKKQHDEHVEAFEAKLEQIRPIMSSKAGKECMDKIDKAWAEYKEIDEKVIKLGATTDSNQSLKAQSMMLNETAPKYEALDNALNELMDTNVAKGDAEKLKLEIFLIIAIVAAIGIIAAVVVVASKAAHAIAKSIEEPLDGMMARFETFAQGDLDSPFPEVETKDEISDLIDSAHAMAERLHNIISDAGKLMGEMADGNFAIATEHEDQYTGAFNALLLGIRNMNRQMNSTLKGVEDASKQVAEGSANLSDAAQSLAEGATDQAATVEERCRQPLMILMKVYRRQQNSWKIHIKKQRDMLIQQKTAEKAWKLLWGQWLVSVRLLRRLAISFQRLKVLQARLTFFHLMLPLRLQEQVMQAEDLQ